MKLTGNFSQHWIRRCSFAFLLRELEVLEALETVEAVKLLEVVVLELDLREDLYQRWRGSGVMR